MARESRSSLVPGPPPPPPGGVCDHRGSTLRSMLDIVIRINSDLFVCMRMHMCVCMCTHGDDPRGQKRALDAQELKLQAVVIQTVCLPGTRLRSSTKAVCALTEPSLRPTFWMAFLKLIESPLSKRIDGCQFQETWPSHSDGSPP